MRGGNATVLMYHRLGEVSDDPFELSVRPERFADHVQVLTETADIVPLREIMQGGGSRIAITFDDGYADCALVAKPILEAAGTPATVFVVSGKIGTAREFWWDELERCLLGTASLPDHLECDIGGRELWVDVRSRAGRERACLALHWRLMRLPLAAIEEHLDRLRSELGIADKCREFRRPLTSSELRDLAHGGLVDIGSHTVTHPDLGLLSVEDQRREVEESRTDVSRIVGEVGAFAYPFGGFTEETVRIVKQAGYQIACTSERRDASSDGDPHRIPRRYVGDWPPATLRARLESWLHSSD